MTSILMLATLVGYFALLLLLARCSGGRGDNASFFSANRQGSWPLVAFGMIAGSISGVTFISVPGWVTATQMTYLQMCMGFIVGYFAVAFLLLPLYYRLQLTSIYSYLGDRFGRWSHRTGALFFFLSKLTGAAARLYLACLVLQQFIATPLGIPFPLTASAVLLLIWGYTYRDGMRSLQLTDALQTLCLLLALGGTLAIVASQLGWSESWELIKGSSMSQVFDWEMASPRNFWRQFLSGVFIVIVMTGLDQDMMQKNLTCRTLRDAQKDMCVYGLAFLPINALFLGLGVLLVHIADAQGLALSGDALFPGLVASGVLGTAIVLPFTIGIVAAAFSAADGAMTALTTSVCVDWLGMEQRSISAVRAERQRRWVHVGVGVAFLGCVLAFRAINSTNVINAIYTMASYTYGPLLGLYAFGQFSKRRVLDSAVPAIALIAPLLCALLDHYAPLLWGYKLGYELLMLNGALTALGLWIFSKRK